MQWATIPDFGRIGSWQLPQGDFTAVAIAPSSEVDFVTVCDQRLGPGGLVPYKQGGGAVLARRGYRTYNAADGTQIAEQLTQVPGSAPGGACGATLVLLLYEKCDPPVPPGPRAPTTVSGFIAGGDLPTTVATAALILRLPFAGRRRASFAFKRTTNAQPLSALVQGIRYLDPEQRRKQISLADTSLGHYSREVVTATWTPAAVLETRDSGCGGYQAAWLNLFDDDDSAGDETPYDELDLYVYGPLAGGAAFACGEAWGERAL